MLDVGASIPEFSLKASDGRMVSSESLRGQRYVLYFYPKDDTPGCTTEACQFRDERPRFDGIKVPVFGVSADTDSSHQKFANKFQLNFPLLADPDKVAVKAYDVDGPLGFGVRRGTYLIGKDGRIQDSVLADLRIGAHEAFVANAIKSGAGKQ